MIRINLSNSINPNDVLIERGTNTEEHADFDRNRYVLKDHVVDVLLVGVVLEAWLVKLADHVVLEGHPGANRIHAHIDRRSPIEGNDDHVDAALIRSREVRSSQS